MYEVVAVCESRGLSLIRESDRLQIIGNCAKCGCEIQKFSSKKAFMKIKWAFCSQRCSNAAQRHGGILRKMKDDAYMRKHGVKNPSSNPEVRKRLKR